MDHRLIRLNLSLGEKIISLPQLKLVYGCLTINFMLHLSGTKWLLLQQLETAPEMFYGPNPRWVWHILLPPLFWKTLKWLLHVGYKNIGQM